MEKKLSVGETLSEVFSIYRDQAGVLLPVAFWLFLVVAIAELLAGDNELSLFLVSFVLGLTITFLYQGWSWAWSKTSGTVVGTTRSAS